MHLYNLVKVEKLLYRIDLKEKVDLVEFLQTLTDDVLIKDTRLAQPK